jgi:hypothetical protein
MGARGRRGEEITSLLPLELGFGFCRVSLNPIEVMLREAKHLAFKAYEKGGIVRRSLS